jgi:hypothetical protein
MFIGTLTENKTDIRQEAYCLRLYAALPHYNPSTDYHLFIDANNAPDWTLDRRGNPAYQQDQPRGFTALRRILDAYSLADNFRYIHPVAREFTHIHHRPGGTQSAKQYDRIYSSRALHRKNAAPRVAQVAHRWPDQSDTTAINITGFTSQVEQPRDCRMYNTVHGHPQSPPPIVHAPPHSKRTHRCEENSLDDRRRRIRI